MLVSQNGFMQHSREFGWLRQSKKPLPTRLACLTCGGSAQASSCAERFTPCWSEISATTSPSTFGHNR